MEAHAGNACALYPPFLVLILVTSMKLDLVDTPRADIESIRKAVFFLQPTGIITSIFDESQIANWRTRVTTGRDPLYLGMGFCSKSEHACSCANRFQRKNRFGGLIERLMFHTSISVDLFNADVTYSLRATGLNRPGFCS